jgi:glycosyltransferase involved in cell wall biosynthesis
MEADRMGVPLVTIVIPSRNECGDIAQTLDLCLALDYPNKEIIVVDDSTDDTPAVVAGYASRGVKLIHRAHNSNGCCGARNEGMRHATGEIVVLLNADARPESHFLRKIIAHYHRGADYVIVRSLVANPFTPWARLTAAMNEADIQKGMDFEWSEGFSCRRAVAEKVGLIPGNFPVNFCRDWRFGLAMRSAGFKKTIDLTISMPHKVPEGFAQWLREMRGRAMMWAPSQYYFEQRTLCIIVLRQMAKTVRGLLYVLLGLPMLLEAARLGRHSEAKWDTLRFFGLMALKEIIYWRGAFRGAYNVLQAEGVSSLWTRYRTP